jgi:hypothetical protein
MRPKVRTGSGLQRSNSHTNCGPSRSFWFLKGSAYELDQPPKLEFDDEVVEQVYFLSDDSAG